MKSYLIDLISGFIGGFLVVFVGVLFALAVPQFGFWWLLILDAILFFAYISLPLFKNRQQSGPRTWGSFGIFNVGILLSGIIMAYYIGSHLGNSQLFLL